jgi:CHAD domain-containing protein
MEIEAKFVLPDAEVLERLLAVDHLAEFALTGKQVKQVKDTYLDTPDRLILAAGFACRQREKDDSVLITLKGLGRAEDGIHRREEYEVLLPACAPLTKWPAGPVRDRVHELVGDAHLVPLFHIEQTRILRQVSQDERVVGELSLDDVLTTAQGKEQGFLELEVELALQGTEEDLKALVACLQDEWKLEPMVLSKFERGLAFLDATQLRERLLTTMERAACEHIASQEDNRNGRRARVLLALDEGVTQIEAARAVGITDRTVRRWLVLFRDKRMDIFPSSILAEAMPSPVSPLPQVEEPPEPWALEKLLDIYGVDRVHARAVADHALALFDHLKPYHGLSEERRPLLEMAALLHNVGLQTNPDRHHIAGRDILLAHPPAELEADERRVVALTTFLHRKRVTRRRLDRLAQRPQFTGLSVSMRRDALALAALVRLADGLDFNQTGASKLGQVVHHEGIVEFEVLGPTAATDAEQAQNKGDLWRLLFDTQVRFRSPAILVETTQPAAQQMAQPPSKPGLDPDDSMAEAARKTFLLHYQRMVYHEPGTRLGEDIEELHDMRVATRRMRAAFRVFGDYLDIREMKPFVKGLRRTGRVLGAVRDLDVFWEKTQRYLDTLPEEKRSGLDPLRAAWEAERERARKRMLAYLDSSRYYEFKKRFGEFLQVRGAGALPTLSDEGEPIPHLVRHVVPVAVHQRLAAVRAYDEWVTRRDVPLERLHQLRIAAKGLRYTVEYFREVLAPEAEDFIDQIKRLQDHLGDLQDAVVASNLLRDFLTWGTWGHSEAEKEGVSLPTEPIIAPGVAAYMTSRQTELQHLVETFPQAWSRIQSPEFKELAAAALAAL